MTGVFDNILNRLARRELILPLFENQFRSDTWPDHYHVRVDSRPWYGTGDGYFHPSTHPLMAPRELYYRFHPDTRDRLEPERRDTALDLAAAMGSCLHAVIQTQMQMAGLLRPENTEREFIDERHKVRGRIDMVIDHPGEGEVVVEIKTRTPYKWSATKLLPAWEAQTSIQLDNLGAERGVVLVVEAGYPFRMKEVPAQRNDALLAEVYAKFDAVRGAIARNEPPEGCCPPEQQNLCPARAVCGAAR